MHTHVLSSPSSRSKRETLGFPPPPYCTPDNTATPVDNRPERQKPSYSILALKNINWSTACSVSHIAHGTGHSSGQESSRGRRHFPLGLCHFVTFHVSTARLHFTEHSATASNRKISSEMTMTQQTTTQKAKI